MTSTQSTGVGAQHILVQRSSAVWHVHERWPQQRLISTGVYRHELNAKHVQHSQLVLGEARVKAAHMWNPKALPQLQHKRKLNPRRSMEHKAANPKHKQLLRLFPPFQLRCHEVCTKRILFTHVQVEQNTLLEVRRSWRAASDGSQRWRRTARTGLRSSTQAPRPARARST